MSDRSLTKSLPPRLIVDGYYLGNGRGMSRYVQSLIDCAPLSAVVLRPPVVGGISGALRRINPIWEQIVLPSAAVKAGGTILLSGFNTGPLAPVGGMRRVQVLHDLIFLSSLGELPLSHDFSQNVGRLYRRLVAPRFARAADSILTVSEFSKCEIVRRLGIDPSRISVIPNSIPDESILAATTPPSARQPIVFAVSGDAPSKNLIGALDVFVRFVAAVPERGYRLVVAGVPERVHSRFRLEAARRGIGDKVAFLPRVDDAELSRHYLNAFAYLCSSWQEGFGIPVLEAMAHGLPVVSSNRTSLPEVIADAGCLYDPADPQAGARALVNLHLNGNDHAAFSRRGIERSRHFARSAVTMTSRAFWTTFIHGSDA